MTGGQDDQGRGVAAGVGDGAADRAASAPRVPGSFALRPHPTSWTPPGWEVNVATRWSAGALLVEYTLAVPAGRLMLPRRSAVPAARDFLWKRTCGELFVGVRGEPGYIEFNFSPSGDWASYAFDGYRENSRPRPWQGPTPEVRVMPGEGVTRLVALVPQQAFLCQQRDGRMPRLEAAFTLVLEADRGDLSFWSLAHPRAQPEFHDRAGFVADFTVPD
ncbi:MAG: DOMON-like domain-containing protein [Gammaproteobacteria bacterium]